ncbi:MAG TPA: TadE/TadG family type IV pilus assembly protein [Candidatus Limnocylindria bacterium]|jgi:Flp pilus assembly protein TadG
MRRFALADRGQSLIEVALALPILLLLVIGIADLGRFAHYAIGVSHAARDAAAYAAKEPGVSQPQILARVCTELGIDGECADVTLTRDAEGATVEVSYSFTLITGVITDRMGGGPIVLHSQASFPGYTQ